MFLILHVKLPQSVILHVLYSLKNIVSYYFTSIPALKIILVRIKPCSLHQHSSLVPAHYLQFLCDQTGQFELRLLLFLWFLTEQEPDNPA